MLEYIFGGHLLTLQLQEEPDCIEAINTYRQEHGLIPMVVCSRKTDYLAQPARVILNTAVVVQPLTEQQIERYVSQAGPELEAMGYALTHDNHLREMASNPLMLTILALSYRDIPLDEALRLIGLVDQVVDGIGLDDDVNLAADAG